jgi:UDP:flavonoid glycosyltransferase YjiC (YdhE family)
MSRIAIALQEAGHEVHLLTVDNERGRNGIPKLVEGTGIQLHLTPGLEMDTIMVDIGKDKIDPKDKFVEAWKPGCMAKIRELKPDIIVADILGKPGLLAADEMGIPCVLNNPAGPLSFYQSIGIGGYPNTNTQTKVRCGKIYMS